MKDEEIKILNRIKDEVSGFSRIEILGNELLIDEVCLRYADEIVSKRLPFDVKSDNLLQEVEHWKSAYHNSTDRERDLVKEIDKLEQEIERLKKIEIKDQSTTQQ